MDVPMSWLKDYVTIDCPIEDFMDAITLTGSKVEGVTHVAGDITRVVVGRVEEITKHPNADKLVVTKINIGKEELVQIVTGATNLKVGDYVPAALDGATLANGVVIKNGELRGVKSNGMLCSVQELGFDLHDFPESSEHGIYVFPTEQVLGVDVVEVMELQDDVVEFEITSNRPDCFSMLGIAREAAATLGQKLRYPIIDVKESAQGDIKDMISVEIQNPALCPRYIARIVKNVKIEPSPRWLRKRLRSAGVRPINNIVDITNFVMIELGQPMHAFDISNIEERKIIIRNARQKEEITTLDGVKRVLEDSMLVISDPKKAVAVAGVMGGENSMVSENAEAILFESANFNGPNVRITAKKLGLRTDASGKYEKGLDPNTALDAVNRAVQLVALLGAGEVVEGMVDCYPNKREPWTLSYCPAWINKLLGTEIAEEEMACIFEKLELDVDREKKEVIVPTFRPDLEAQVDLAEEIARIYGYDKIVATLASGTPTAGKRTKEQNIRSIIKDAMIAMGQCEAMSYTFESPKVFDKLNIAADSALRKAIVISNPLGEDFSIMRTTTLHGILNSLSINYNRRNEEAALFEIGKIYIPKELPLTQLPQEPEKLTMAMYGAKVDFYHLKGIVEHVLDVLGITEGVSFSTENTITWMHPGRTAKVSVGGIDIGYLGELHPCVVDNYEIGTRVYISVLDVAALIQNARLVNSYQPLPKFPAVSRDIAMLVDEEITVKEIEGVIKANAGSLLETITLFDVYKGSQIAQGKKSVAYSITFRAQDRTLVENEVGEKMKEIIQGLTKELNAVLRDKA